MPLPDGYAFRVNGQPTPPNLMQRHFAVRVRERKRVGNWSGTGAGKTLAAILATRVVGSRLTVVCCPNSVVDGWRDAQGYDSLSLGSFRTLANALAPAGDAAPGANGNMVFIQKTASTTLSPRSLNA